jgi:DNA-binding response OmpR family regulator
MSMALIRTRSLCVVDTQPGDYDGVEALAAAATLTVRYFGRAGEALRGETDDDWLWIINARLPDMSGFELCEMLRRTPRAGYVVCVVSDDYSADDERRARASGASVYTGKPLPGGFLACWLESLVPRAGPYAPFSPAVAHVQAADSTPRCEVSSCGVVAARTPRHLSPPGITTSNFGR